MATHQPSEHDHITLDSGDAEPVGLLYVGDVHALRRAETVAFRSGDGSSWIDAGLFSAPAGTPRVYTATEQRLFPDADALDRRRRIPVVGDIAGFDERQRWHEHHLPTATAYATIGAARLDEVWRSISAFVRVGDMVRLHWRADNTSDGLVDPEWHRDELSIGIHRGRRRWMFLLDVQIRPDPARMITRTPT